MNNIPQVNIIEILNDKHNKEKFTSLNVVACSLIISSMSVEADEKNR